MTPKTPMRAAYEGKPARRPTNLNAPPKVMSSASFQLFYPTGLSKILLFSKLMLISVATLALILNRPEVTR